MSKFYIIFLAFLFSIKIAFGQVVVTNPGNTTPNLAATYTTLANAISALNGVTAITGPVVITLNPGNPQTTPIGGYSINYSATATVVNNIRIDGGGNTITAYSPQASGSYTDAIFKIIGSDYLTLENFVLQENPLNNKISNSTNNMTEWGVALLVNNQINGAQHNTIRNNTISLDKTYQNTFGVYSNTSHAPNNISVDKQVLNGTAAPNHYNKIYSNYISNVNMGITIIGSSNPQYMDDGNDIGGSSSSTGNTITNFGGKYATASFFYNSGVVYGIFSNHQINENIAYNTLESSTLTGSGTVRGIVKTYSKFNPDVNATITSTIAHNIITYDNQFTTGTFELIRSEAQNSDLPNFTININNNELINNIALNVVITGIINTARYGTLNINYNTFKNNILSASSGTFSGISNTALIPGLININNNMFGDFTSSAFKFTAATPSGTINGITCTTTNSNFSISNNKFRGFVFDNPGTTVTNYITYLNAPTTPTNGLLSANTFKRINIESSGQTTFINRTGVMGAGANATETIDKNIVDTVIKNNSAGNLYGFYGTGNSTPGNSFIITGNKFQNWSGQAVNVSAINSNDGSNSLQLIKVVNNNTINNWNFTGTSIVSPIIIKNASNTSKASGNTLIKIITSTNLIGININSTDATGEIELLNNIIDTINSEEGFTGINATTTSGSAFGFTVKSNKLTNINCLNPTSGSQISGIYISGAMGGIVEKNILGNITVSGSSFILSGIRLAAVSGDSYTVQNNLIGKLNVVGGDDPRTIRAIYLMDGGGANSTYYLYHNTVYLDASNGGINFGSCALYSQGINNATSNKVILQNNILINISVANGTGVTASYIRNGASFTNYDNASNNNIFYAGIPSPSNLIFSNTTNNDQLLSAFQTRIAPAESASQTELSPFLSLNPNDPTYLHINPLVVTRSESGGMVISAGVDTDIDNDIRHGYPGYSGAGTAPDIGADEFNGIITEFDAPDISYTVITTPNCVSVGMTLSNVTITDASGIPLSGLDVPRIYYHKNSDPWYSTAGSFNSGTASNSVWTFSILEADMGGVSGGDVVEYFVVAQDISPAKNVGSSPAVGLIATNVHTIVTPPTPSNFYTVNYSLSGTYTVGSGGNFSTLTEAINAYNNACALLAPVIFSLLDNDYTTPTETFPIVINQHPDASATKTLTIRPATSATSTIKGNNNSQIILYDGADYVFFDGRQNGIGTSRNLTISNEGVGVTIQFINDATNNIVRYSNVQGRRASSFSGVIFFGTTSIPSGTGNSNNLIEYNAISPSNDFPTNGIYSGGTAGSGNDNIEISHNLIYDNFNPASDNHGIYVSGLGTATNWNIHNNKLFQTALRLFDGSNNRLVYGIRITSGSGHTIKDNSIGFANESGTGSTMLVGNNTLMPGFPTSYTLAGSSTNLRYIGIAGDFESGPKSNIDGNIIGGIAIFSGAPTSIPGHFTGIYIEGGPVDIGKISGNTIGSTTDQSSIYVASASSSYNEVIGIRMVPAQNSEVANNIFGGILVSGTTNTTTGNFTGISAGGSAQYNIHDNTFGNNTPNNIRLGFSTSGGNLSSTGTLQPTAETVPGTFTGIFCNLSQATPAVPLTITGNTFQGWEVSQKLTEVKAILTQNVTVFFITANNTIVTASNNNAGSYTSPFLRFTEPSTKELKVFDIASNCKSAVVDNNFFGEIHYAKPTIQPGAKMIVVNTQGTSGNLCSISGNTFYKLSLQEAEVSYIEPAFNMSSGFTLNILNNKTEDSTQLSGRFYGVKMNTNAVAGTNVHLTGNNFSRIKTAGNTFLIFDQLKSGLNNSPNRRVLNNNFSRINASNGMLSGIWVEYTGSTSASNIDSFVNNTIKELTTTNGDISGITINKNTNSSSGVVITQNEVSYLSSSGLNSNAIGISANLPSTNSTSFISNNTIYSILTGSSGRYSTGLQIGNSSTKVVSNANKIYQISHTGNPGYVSGIRVGDTGIASLNEIKLYNNLIGILSATNAGDATLPVVVGLNIFNNNAAGQIDVVNNTLSLNTTGTIPNFSTAGIFTTSNGNITIENNIVANTSVPGSSGKTVAHWRNGPFSAGITGFANDYYLGSTAPNIMIGYDATNSYITLTDYKTNFGTDEQNSVSVAPVFLSIIGANPSFLHLSPVSNCNLLGIATNDHHLLPADFDGDLREIPPPAGSVTSIGADESFKGNVWTGASNTQWNNAANWSMGTVPNSNTENVFITLLPPANQPTIASNEIFQVQRLFISSGAILNNYGTLKIAGGIKGNSGSINNINGGNVEGSIEYNTFCNVQQQIEGSIFYDNKINNLIISGNTELSSGVGEELYIHGALSFGAVSSKNFKTNDNIILVSKENQTAWVGKITNSNKIIGKATIERYINTGLIADGRHIKSWQFLATPITSGSSPSIYSSWQENGTAPTGYGTIITGTGSGFDITTNEPSMKWYDGTLGVNGEWVGITNTASAISQPKGYMVFVRGDRSVTTYNADATPTNMRIKGELFQPGTPPPTVSVPAAKWASVGNPYAAAIDVEYMKDNSLFTNLTNDVVVWDPLLAGSYNLGGYQTLAAANNYEPTAGGTAYYPAATACKEIQSGQAFFVKSSGSAGQVSFTEDCKLDGSRLVNRDILNDDRWFLRAKLYTNEQIICDGNAAVFSTSYHKGIDENDASKMFNSGENFSIVIDNELFSVEARSTPVTGDTVYYSLKNLKQQVYKIVFSPQGIPSRRLTPFLIDRYLGTSTALSLVGSTEIQFRISADQNSKRTDRFYIVFKDRNRHSSTIPIGEYTISKKPIEYPIKISLKNNPISNFMLNLRYEGLAGGNYPLVILDIQGREILSTKIFSTGKSAQWCTVSLPTFLPRGQYIIHIPTDRNNINLKFVVW